MFECTILADSTYEAPSGALQSDYRLTTFQITHPRFILAEVNTHKMISKNSASSRAIPVAKSIDAVLRDPFIPSEFGSNQKGMVGGTALSGDDHYRAETTWTKAMHAAVSRAQELEEIEVHKGLANRILEPFKWHTCILTGTDWSNFFALRTAANAQPEFRTIATMMQEAYEASTPYELAPGAWHLPLVDLAELTEGYQRHTPDYAYWAKISAARCARVSYLTHDGKRDLDADIKLAEFLMGNGHLSPFEHVARPFNEDEWRLVNDLQRYLHDAGWMGRADNAFAAYLEKQVEYRGNLRGWWFLRADIPNEHDFSLNQEA